MERSTCLRLLLFAIGCSADFVAQPPTCQSEGQCSSLFSVRACGSPSLIEEALVPVTMTLELCAEVCRQTISCRFFTLDGQTCRSFSACKDTGESTEVHDVHELPLNPARCGWDFEAERQEQAHLAQVAATLEGWLITLSNSSRLHTACPAPCHLQKISVLNPLGRWA